MQFSCVPGNDGGIKQYFNVEVQFESMQTLFILILSFFINTFFKMVFQVFEESTRDKIFNISFTNPTFILKKLPSDTKLIIKVKIIHQGNIPFPIFPTFS